MIRYAITAGNHLSFLKRNRLTRPCGSPCPDASCPESSAPSAGFLPFPPSTSLLDQVRQLAQHGVDFIQLREKHLSASELAALAQHLLDLLRQAASAGSCQTRLLINARADIAAATGAHGVHLPATPGVLTPLQVHRLYRSIGLPAPFVSKSCHTLPEVRATLHQQPDLILFSPIFGKSVNSLPVAAGIGLEALAAACHLAYPIPVLALGGITPANTSSCLHAGAAGVAGIRLFAPDHAVPRQA